MLQRATHLIAQLNWLDKEVPQTSAIHRFTSPLQVISCHRLYTRLDNPDPLLLHVSWQLT